MSIAADFNGMMTGNGATTFIYDDGNPGQASRLHLEWSSQPKGTLYIRNLTRGTEKAVKLSQATYGAVVWDLATDDPTGQVGDIFEFEVNGKADQLEVRHVGDYVAYFDGNGTGTISGSEAIASE